VESPARPAQPRPPGVCSGQRVSGGPGPRRRLEWLTRSKAFFTSRLLQSACRVTTRIEVCLFVCDRLATYAEWKSGLVPPQEPKCGSGCPQVGCRWQACGRGDPASTKATVTATTDRQVPPSLESTSRPRGRLQPPAGPSETPDRLTHSKRSPPVTRTTVTRSGLRQTLSRKKAPQDGQGQGLVDQPCPRQPRARRGGATQPTRVVSWNSRGFVSKSRGVVAHLLTPSTDPDVVQPKHEERLTLPPGWVAVLSKQPFRNAGKGQQYWYAAPPCPLAACSELFWTPPTSTWTQ
jgi:hypothetical protein